ncbi:hypothetical protein ACFQH5_20360 [Halomonas salifodinae]|uniref:Uncharacterized protein n=1 Tax=Halomonas salifodinae TaxID=438745 RepID=A0ABW2F1J0_9GAMM
MKPIEFEYTNWRGERATRRAIPISIAWASTDYHPEPQWLMTARDLEKNATRDFALRDMENIREVES